MLRLFAFSLLLLHAFPLVRAAEQTAGGSDSRTPTSNPNPSSSSSIIGSSNNNSSSSSSSSIDVDCKGGYGAWSPCEPLEGHDTHHDSEDEFNLQRGPDGYYVGECFQYRTFHIITAARGNGNKCSKRDGSKVFRYCSDCSALPAVYKHLQAPQQQVSSLRFFALIAGLLCLVTTIVFVAICLKKLLIHDGPPIHQYPPSAERIEQAHLEPTKGLCLTPEESTQAAASR